MKRFYLIFLTVPVLIGVTYRSVRKTQNNNLVETKSKSKIKKALKTLVFAYTFTVGVNRVGSYVDKKLFATEHSNAILMCCSDDKYKSEKSGYSSKRFSKEYLEMKHAKPDSPENDGRNTPAFFEFCEKLEKLSEKFEFFPEGPYRRFTDANERFVRYMQLIEIARDPETGKFTKRSMDQAIELIEKEFEASIIHTRRADPKMREKNIAFVFEVTNSGKIVYLSPDLKPVNENGEPFE